MSYGAYQPIIKAASKRPALWRLALGIITVFVFFVLWAVGLIAALGLLRGEGFFHSAQTSLSLQNQTPTTAATYLILVWGLGLGTFVAAKIWHGRKLRSLTGNGSKTLHHFLIASLTTFAIIGVISLISLPFSDTPSLKMDPWIWVLFLPLGLIAVAGQTLAEEILFRGYIQSQLAGRFTHPLVWIVFPAILFGFAHYLPGQPTSTAMGYVLIAAFFGLLAADLTARTGNLGAAWGFHFANNTLAILVVATEGSLTGLGLFKSPEGLGDQITLSPWIAFDIAVLFAIYLLIRRIVAR